MGKWIKVLVFLVSVWCVCGIRTYAGDEGTPYIVDMIEDNNELMLFETGTVITREMLPSMLDVRVLVSNGAVPPPARQLPVTWNIDECGQAAAGGVVTITGQLNLPSGYVTEADYEDPQLRIIYRDKGPVSDLEGRYRGRSVTLWFNHLSEEYPYYVTIPDAGHVWMQYSKDGKVWESEEIRYPEDSYTANKIFDGTPYMFRLYVESGLQAGYSNTIWLPYPPENIGQNGGGDSGADQGDDIGGNRGGGSAVLPLPEDLLDKDNEEDQSSKPAGSSSSAGSGSDDAKEENQDNADPKQNGEKEADTEKTYADGSASGNEKGNASQKNAGAIQEGEEIQEDEGISLWTFIAGIVLLLLCIAAGTVGLKLVRYYKR